MKGKNVSYTTASFELRQAKTGSWRACGQETVTLLTWLDSGARLAGSSHADLLGNSQIPMRSRRVPQTSNRRLEGRSGTAGCIRSLPCEPRSFAAVAPITGKFTDPQKGRHRYRGQHAQRTFLIDDLHCLSSRRMQTVTLKLSRGPNIGHARQSTTKCLNK